jgi:hypothetical protein
MGKESEEKGKSSNHVLAGVPSLTDSFCFSHLTNIDGVIDSRVQLYPVSKSLEDRNALNLDIADTGPGSGVL